MAMTKSGAHWEISLRTRKVCKGKCTESAMELHMIQRTSIKEQAYVRGRWRRFLTFLAVARALLLAATGFG